MWAARRSAGRARALRGDRRGGVPLRPEFPGARILVIGPSSGREIAQAREARLELTVPRRPIPEGVPVHLKLDTGMGRWGLSELPAPPARRGRPDDPPGERGLRPGVHSAQIERFAEATGRSPT